MTFIKWATYLLFCYLAMILPMYLDGFINKGVHKIPIRSFILLYAVLQFALLVAQFKIKRFFRTGSDSISENPNLFPGTRYTSSTSNREIYGLGQVLNVFQISDSLFSTQKPKDRAEKQKEAMEAGDASKTCIVCYENVPNTINNPCKHGGVCDPCAREIRKRSKKCLLCRRELYSVIVYEY